MKKIFICLTLITGISFSSTIQAQVVDVVPYDNDQLGTPPNSRVSPEISDYSDNNDANTFGTVYSYSIGVGDTISGIGYNGNTSGGNNVKPNNTITLWGGTNSTARTVEISIRATTDYERAGGYIANGPHIPPFIGNPFKLNGLGTGTISGSREQTDPYAIVGTYDQAEFEATTNLTEIQELQAGHLVIGWLNPEVDGNASSFSQGDPWVNAIQGNFDNSEDFSSRVDIDGVLTNPLIDTTFEQYVEGTTTVLGANTKLAGQMRVGDWGGEDDTNELWAVIDHASTFGVVPEASDYSLLLGLLAIPLVFRRFCRR